MSIWNLICFLITHFNQFFLVTMPPNSQYFTSKILGLIGSCFYFFLGIGDYWRREDNRFLEFGSEGKNARRQWVSPIIYLVFWLHINANSFFRVLFDAVVILCLKSTRIIWLLFSCSCAQPAGRLQHVIVFFQQGTCLR